MGTKKQTTTPTNPAWVNEGVQSIMGGIAEAGKRDPLSRIAGTNPLLDRATSMLSGDPYAEARAMISAGAGGGGSVSATKASDYYDAYKNPYRRDVVDSALADFDFGAGQTRAAEDLDIAGSKGFGGSGSAIRQAMTDEGLVRGRASTSAGLLQDMFDKAMGLGSEDASRGLQASIANANLAESAAERKMRGGQTLAGLTGQELGQQLSLGEYLRGLENERLNADTSQLSQLTALTSGLPLDLFNGSKTKTSGGTLGAIGSGLLGAASLFAAPMTGGLSLGGLGGLLGGGAAAGAGSLFGGSNLLGTLTSQVAPRFSDRRLKRDIHRVGTRPDGLGIYLFRYLWSPVVYLGVMAQEVLGVKPGAVIVTPSGYLAVDYGAI